MTKPYAWMTVKKWEPARNAGDQPEIMLSQKSISQFCRDFNCAAGSLDPNFGIIRITLPPDEPVHTLMIEPAEAEKMARQHPEYFDGPWQDYNIGPAATQNKPSAPKP